MKSIILKWVNGQLVVDASSLHHFGIDVPEGCINPQGTYEVKIAEITELQQA